MFSGDTECFNGKVWKRLEDYKPSDRVLTYNEDGTASLERPTCFAKSSMESITNSGYDFYDNISDRLPFRLSGDAFLVCRGSNSGIEKVRVSDVVQGNNILKDKRVITSCIVEDSLYSSKVMKNVLIGYKNNTLFDCKFIERERGEFDDVVFTDYILGASLNSRLKVLKLVNLVGVDFCYRTASKKNAERLACLYNMSHVDSSACVSEVISDKMYEVVPVEVRSKDISNGYNLVLSNFKYSFNVSTGMVVVRRNGIIFVVGM